MGKYKCAKRHVIAKIVTVDGEEFYGTNSINNKIDKCPRKPGEDYTKCVEVCDQRDHAEGEALFKAGDKAKGSTMYVYGHDHMCVECMDAALEAGVSHFITGAK
jgi:NAD-dependent dihydropyrimidine dehydrogenase PreA subunit